MRYVLLIIIGTLASIVLARPIKWVWDKFMAFVKRIDPHKIEQGLTSEHVEEKEKENDKS